MPAKCWVKFSFSFPQYFKLSIAVTCIDTVLLALTQPQSPSCDVEQETMGETQGAPGIGALSQL